MDRAGRWHVAFTAIPEPVPAPGNGRVVGIDRGVAVSAALSTGDRLQVPGLSGESRTSCGGWNASSPAPRRARRAAAQVGTRRALRARETDRRKDWVEQTSTEIVRRFDVIKVEDLRVKNMTRSAKGTREKPGAGSGRRPG